jgi:hypothetical protein
MPVDLNVTVVSAKEASKAVEWDPHPAFRTVQVSMTVLEVWETAVWVKGASKAEEGDLDPAFRAVLVSMSALVF